MATNDAFITALSCLIRKEHKSAQQMCDAVDGLEPRIWRRLVTHLHRKFAMLNHVLKAAESRTNCRRHQMKIRSPGCFTWLTRCNLLALSVSLLPSTASTQPSSFWEHNGSAVALFANGPSRVFRYESPRPGMRDLGVLKGTLLFNGTKSGDTYSGTAYIFSSHCGATPYSVAGNVSRDGKLVTLAGNAPSMFDSACHPIAYRHDVLKFEFRSQTGSSPSQAINTLVIGTNAFGLHPNSALIAGQRINLTPIDDGSYDASDVELWVANLSGMKPFFARLAPGIKNAYAVIGQNTRLMIYDPNWANNQTSTLLVLAHEIGHHICGHTVGIVQEDPRNRELEADRYAGAALKRLEYKTIDEILDAARTSFSEQETRTHPSRDARIAAITEGFYRGSTCEARKVVVPAPLPTQTELAKASEKFCREVADGFCQILKDTPVNQRVGLWHRYGIIVGNCNDAGIKLPAMRKRSDGVWIYPGVDCSTGRGRLVPE